MLSVAKTPTVTLFIFNVLSQFWSATACRRFGTALIVLKIVPDDIAT